LYKEGTTNDLATPSWPQNASKRIKLNQQFVNVISFSKTYEIFVKDILTNYKLSNSKWKQRHIIS
jgi:hypothetical protein